MWCGQALYRLGVQGVRVLLLLDFFFSAKCGSSVTAKKMVTKLKRPPIQWEKIFASYTSNKGLIMKIYSVLKNKLPKKH
jgi:hypothetical protein